MDERGRAVVRLGRTRVRVLFQDAIASDAHPFGVGALCVGFRFDRGDEIRAGCAVACGREVSPWGQRGEMDVVPGGEHARDDVFGATTGVVFRRSVVPGAGKRVTGSESTNTGQPGPITWAIDQPLLTSVLEDVSEARNSGVVIGDHDGAIATGPEALAPVVKSAELARDVAVDESDEGGELGGVVDRKQSMPMIGQDDEGMDANRAKRLGASHDTEEEVVDLV